MIFKIEKGNKHLDAVIDSEQIETKEVGAEIAIECHSMRDVYDLGYMVGREEFTEKPQSFYLPIEQCEILRKAIEKWENDTSKMCDSITFRTEGCPTDCHEVYVYPTQLSALFGIFSRYGEMRNGSPSKKEPTIKRTKIENGIVVHCPTTEEAQQVLKVFSENGIFSWASGEPLSNESIIPEATISYGENLCFRVRHGSVSYASVNFYEKETRTTPIPAAEFLKSHA